MFFQGVVLDFTFVKLLHELSTSSGFSIVLFPPFRHCVLELVFGLNDGYPLFVLLKQLSACLVEKIVELEVLFCVVFSGKLPKLCGLLPQLAEQSPSELSILVPFFPFPLQF
jgi:hypothetical protein